MNLKKVFGIATASAIVAIPVPVIGPIAGFVVGGVGAAAYEIANKKKQNDKKKGPGL